MDKPNKRRYNEEFIDILEQLAKLLAQQGEPFRARAYKNAEETIREMSDIDITSVDDLRGKPNIGKTVLEKLQEYIDTGKIDLLEKEKGKPEYIFSEIHGIGPKKARDLVGMGITTITQLKERQNEVLNDVQRKGLKYFEDILQRIPRSEIDEYKKVFEEGLPKSPESPIKMEIVGSYRRGAATSGDIDVILTSSNKKDFGVFLENLRGSGIILETLACGSTKCFVITCLPKHNVARRVDFMYTSEEEYPFAVLYFTGSKTFNTIMRGNALKMGYSLNEHGLYIKKPGQKKEEKIDKAFKEERDIFSFLNMEYREPSDREMDVKPGVKTLAEEPIKTMKKESAKVVETTREIPIIPTEKAVKKRGRPPKAKVFTQPIIEGSPKKTLKKRGRPPKAKPPVVEGLLKTRKIRKKEPLMDNLTMKLAIVPPKVSSPKKTKKRGRKPKAEKGAPKELTIPKITIDVKEQPKLENIPLPGEEIETFKPQKTVYANKTMKKRGRPPKQKSDALIIPQVPVIPQMTVVPPPKEKKNKKTLKIREGEKIIIKGKTENLPKTEIKKDKIEEKKELKTSPLPLNKTVKKMSSKTTAKKHINEFKLHGIKIIENLSEKDITNIIIVANDAYYNKKPLLTDNEYDIVREYAEKKYPQNQVIREVGAPVTKNKVKLPYNMPSMDKIKPDTNALTSWTAKYKGPYVLSCKLDGVSGMYVGEPKVPPTTPSSSTKILTGGSKLYTRGDGKIGQDITHLLKVLNLPKIENEELAIRGEFIIPKKVFEEKYKSEFANPRNLVSGIINSKTVDIKAQDLHFVAYEIIHPPMTVGEQMSKLEELGFEVVKHQSVEELSNKFLSETLIDWRSSYDYEIDGIIVADDHIHPRKDGNPQHAFAFKMVISDQIAEAKVVDVLWEPSKSGYLKPRVQIEPVQLGGVTIQYATGFNGNFIETNKIGIGAIIQIIRSGDVIPHIKSVTVPAERAKMPDMPYTWTKNHVDIVLENVEEDITVRRKNITEFFKWLEVDGLSGKTVERIMEAGFDTLPRILKMNKDDFSKVRGFKDTMINKIHDGIKEKVSKASLLDIMIASNMFGRGISEKKLRPIMTEYPDVLTSSESKESKYNRIIKIKGIGTENTQSFIDGIDRFLAFLKEADLEEKLYQKIESVKGAVEKRDFDTSHPLYQKHIVMTKVRDKDIKEKLEAVGGILDEGIGKNTFALIVKSKEDESNKTRYAKENNIPIYEPREFLEKYF